MINNTNKQILERRKQAKNWKIVRIW